MKKGGGHGKGTAAERKVAVMLSAWWFGGKGYLWRKPGNEVRNYERFPHSGDIVPTHTYRYPKKDIAKQMQWPFHAEVKSWGKGKLKLWHLLDKQSQAPIIRVWDKAVRKRRKDLDVMLVLRENHHDWLIFMTRKTWRRYFGVDTASPSICFSSNGRSIVGMPWKVVARLTRKRLCVKKI